MQKAKSARTFLQKQVTNLPFYRNRRKKKRPVEDSSSNEILHLQQTIGNQAVAKLMQAKLKVGQPGDKYEQEADQVADSVMSMPESQIQRQEEEEIQAQPEEEEELQMQAEEEEELQKQPEEEEEEALQGKENSSRTSVVTPKVQTSLYAMRGSGKPLPKSTRAFFEPRFGQNFSQVRVHNDSQAAEAAKKVKAKAFTVGRDVVFGNGQYSPETTTGKKLLAHELMHVVQQRNADQATMPQILRKDPKKPGFEKKKSKAFYLKEGAELFKKALFGMTLEGPGYYDASSWKELPKKAAIQAIISPWEAMNRLVKNINNLVPSPVGGLTRWKFDCLEFTQLIRIYTYWRMMKKTSFNTKFSPLELGVNATTLRWKQRKVIQWLPKDAPVYAEEVKGVWQETPTKKPMKDLLDKAPISSHVEWRNWDAVGKCGKKPRPAFCDIEIQHTIKAGKDQYIAHPFGILDERTLKFEMAKAVVGEKLASDDYIRKNIYVASIRYPVEM